MAIADRTTTVACDGACAKGRGAWAATVREGGLPSRVLTGAAEGTTNNRMELTAVCEGLEATARDDGTGILVLTDSQYVVSCARVAGRPLAPGMANRDLRERLASAVAGRHVKFKWQRAAHGNAVGRCHRLALAARKAGGPVPADAVPSGHLDDQPPETLARVVATSRRVPEWLRRQAGRALAARAAADGGLPMPFGKHKGTPIRELPDGYLAWLSGLADLREPLAGCVREEMRKRAAPGLSPGEGAPRLAPPGASGKVDE